MASSKEKLLSFATYLKDRGFPWSSTEEVERDGDEFIITVGVSYKTQRGTDGEWIDCEVQRVVRGKMGGAYQYNDSTSDNALLDCLMLAFGEDPTDGEK